MIIGYYTPGLYAREADRLRRSLDRLSLRYELEEVPDQGGWLANTRFKGPWLVRRRRECRGQLLYVDVDAVFHSDPWPALLAMGGDLGVHHHKGELLSGTILLNDTEACQRLIEAWAVLCRKTAKWDQRLLAQAVKSSAEAVEVVELRPEFAFVFDTMRRAYPRLQPVIEHLQASRERGNRRRPKLIRRRRRLDGLESLLATSSIQTKKADQTAPSDADAGIGREASEARNTP